MKSIIGKDHPIAKTRLKEFLKKHFFLTKTNPKIFRKKNYATRL